MIEEEPLLEVDDIIDDTDNIIALKISKKLTEDLTIKQRILNTIPNNIIRNPIINIPESDLIFQAISWYGCDIENPDDIIDPDCDPSKDDGSGPGFNYQIFIHGLTYDPDNETKVSFNESTSNKSICMRVLNFTPYFFVELPDYYNENDTKKLFNKITVKMGLHATSDFVNKWYSQSLAKGLIGYKMVLRKKLYPYEADRQYKFIQLIFNNMKSFNVCKSKFKDDQKDPIFRFKKYESNVDPINRFCHVQDIDTAGFLKINKGLFQIDSEKPSSAQLSLTCSYQDISRQNFDVICKMSILSWDIECQSSTGSFPDPKNKDDYIGQIGITVWSYGTNEKTRIILTNRPCAKDSNNILTTSEKSINNDSIYVLDQPTNDHLIGEELLLKTFLTLVNMIDPDYITGYNTWGFDDKYLHQRCLLYSLNLNEYSRLSFIDTSLKTRKLSSGAMGNNEFFVLDCYGRETFDLLVCIRRQEKLSSYKLDDVGFNFTGQRKEDLPYKEVFRKMSNGTAEEIAEVAIYCIQDTNLVIEILKNLYILSNFNQMANNTCVPLDWLLFRGQQCKIFSLIVKEARKQGYLVPVVIEQIYTEIVDGALVLDPIISACYKPVSGLDFASLYPSIMIAFNICYSTIVLNPEKIPQEDLKDPKKYETIAWKVEDPLSSNYGKKYSFTYSQNGGILSTILKNLWVGRKNTKKQLKDYKKGSLIWCVLEGKQLAIKQVMNAVYGFTITGSQGILACNALGASVCARGRDNLLKVCSLVKENYACDILYGDSIPASTEVYIGHKDVIQKVKVSLLKDIVSGEWIPYRMFKGFDKTRMDKQQIDLINQSFYTKTASGSSLIKRIIRHKVPNKKLYEVVVKDSDGVLRSVVLTEGHSLIGEDGRWLEASKLMIGSRLKVPPKDF